MRVISQDGSIDVPYEMAVVYVECEGVIAKVGDKRYVMGSYSTEKKAIKAMEMLREHNEGVIFLKTIINTEKGTPFVSGLSKTDFNKLTQNYFQFSQDDEIEV
jgi:hypothetical protein